MRMLRQRNVLKKPGRSLKHKRKKNAERRRKNSEKRRKNAGRKKKSAKFGNVRKEGKSFWM